MRRSTLLVLALVSCLYTPAGAQVSQQIGVGDTALLFGGSDAEGGIGDWYLSNGVVEAIIDDVNIQADLTAVVGGGNEPPTQSEAAFTGGNLIDLGRVGANDDQLAQMFSVGGLSTSNFILYQSISAPSPGTVRATGKLLFPPVSPASSPCVDVVTDYTASGSDPFITVTNSTTNNCASPVTGFGGFLDVFIWTQRGLLPFSGSGAPPLGGRGFHHPTLDLGNPVASLEVFGFLAAPGQLRPADGIMDPANSTTSGEVAYGLLGVDVETDADGPGGASPVNSAVNALFGVSSTLISALGNAPVLGGTAVGATLTYRRRIYVGAGNDVRSVSNGTLAELASRLAFSTGTISGDVGATDTANVEASIVATRIGRCTITPGVNCKSNTDCGVNGPCIDTVPTPGQGVGGATTQVRTDSTGAFSGVVLPVGRYELVVSAAERDDVTIPAVTVNAGNNPVAIPNMTGRGTIAFEVREKKPGVPLLPAKITFIGVMPTPNPRFKRDMNVTLGGNDVEPESFGGTQAGTTGHAAGQGNTVFTATGQGDIQLSPGTYDVYASRGNEYSVQREQVVVVAGSTSSVDFKLKRVIRTTDALSADFHVHSGRSLDASAPLRDRVAAFAGEGVEVMVSTDHDKYVDYSGFITAFGLGSRMRSIVGNEVTGSVPNPPLFPQSYGHINAWPFVVFPNEPREGTIQDEFVAPNWLYKRLRDNGAQVIQYNHPRAGVSGLTSIGVFNNIGCNRCANDIDQTCTQDSDCPAAPPPQDCTCVGYQPDRTIGTAPNDILLDNGVLGPGTPANTFGYDNLDFDVIELLNGIKNSDYPGLRQVRRDWLSLLNQAIFKPGTAVSDSHRITVEHAGWARTYVLGAGDDPATFVPATFNSRVNAGAMLMSGGPYITFTARALNSSASAGMGGLVPATNGKVKLKIKVYTPAWMPIEEVRIIANGFQVAAYDATTSPRVKPTPSNFESTGGTSRFSASLIRTITQDTYFVVEAGPKYPALVTTLPVPPPIVDIVEPDVVPLAITNPIFVDREGDAVFSPPGLPVMMASAAPPPADDNPGLWQRVRDVFALLATRFRGEAVAQRQAPGEMTGVTKEQKAEAAKEGEYFPLHEFTFPPEALEAVRKAIEESEHPAAPAEAPGKE
jgi:hypothetical protein